MVVVRLTKKNVVDSVGDGVGDDKVDSKLWWWRWSK